jgi:acetyltransferase-like isoleucine patch superfamily enzyme
MFHAILRQAFSLSWRVRNTIRGCLVRVQIPTVGAGALFFGKITIIGGKNIKIGQYVRFGDRVLLSAQEGNIVINDLCTLLNDVEVISLGNILIGRESTLNNNVVIKGPGVKIGEKVWVAQGCIIEGADVRIGDRVIFGPYVHINDGVHRIDPETHEILMEPGETEPIRIGENAWIGSGAMILRGVNIGPGAIIGARSVVTKDIPAFTIAVGNPARVIQNRLTGEKLDGDS